MSASSCSNPFHLSLLCQSGSAGHSSSSFYVAVHNTICAAAPVCVCRSLSETTFINPEEENPCSISIDGKETSRRKNKCCLLFAPLGGRERQVQEINRRKGSSCFSCCIYRLQLQAQIKLFPLDSFLTHIFHAKRGRNTFHKRKFTHLVFPW